MSARVLLALDCLFAVLLWLWLYVYVWRER